MIGDSDEISGDNPSLAPESPQAETISREKKSFSMEFTQWLQQFESEPSAEKKIQLAIAFMRSLLSQDETPRFKDFWECRRLCLLLFKESITPKARAQLWSEYVELSNEARRLKDILDEQAAFAIEQIELAILSIEGDLENWPVLLANAEDIEFPKENVSVKDRRETYNAIQKELQLLNTLASRINALRKEVIKTDMRIRIKNRLLERLSACGDRVFPRRKDLIQEISKEFISTIDQFVATYFKTGEIKELPLHILREEIKFLQVLAKVLTLNTQTFTDVRLKLEGSQERGISEKADASSKL
jgi:hypothetical protein